MAIVRDARAEDAAEVAGVHIRAWQAAYRCLLPDEYLDGLQVEDRAARYAFGSTDPEAPRTILAIYDGSIRGFASIGPSREQETRDAGELYALYVDPPHWGTGIGRLLLAQACTRLRKLGFDEAVLWVLIGNEQAERFYRVDGWLPDGSRRQEDIWGVQADVIRYRRALA